MSNEIAVAVGSVLVFVFLVMLRIARNKQKKVEKETFHSLIFPMSNPEPIKEIKERTYYCNSCGIEISKTECIENDGQCDQCIEDDEDSDLILGGGW